VRSAVAVIEVTDEAGRVWVTSAVLSDTLKAKDGRAERGWDGPPSQVTSFQVVLEKERDGREKLAP
jgi:hypothetical protein